MHETMLSCQLNIIWDVCGSHLNMIDSTGINYRKDTGLDDEIQRMKKRGKRSKDDMKPGPEEDHHPSTIQSHNISAQPNQPAHRSTVSQRVQFYNSLEDGCRNDPLKPFREDFASSLFQAKGVQTHQNNGSVSGMRDNGEKRMLAGATRAKETLTAWRAQRRVGGDEVGCEATVNQKRCNSVFGNREGDYKANATTAAVSRLIEQYEAEMCSQFE